MAEPLDEALYALEIRERLAQAYAAAMHAQHAGGRVEIHLGSAVVAHLKALAAQAGLTPGARLWDFPVLEKTGPGARQHISVHTVHTIA